MSSLCRTQALLFAMILASGAAEAQAPPRVTFGASAGARVHAASFSDVAHPVVFGEEATIRTDYDGNRALGLEAGVMVRLWSRLGASVSVARHTHDVNGAIEAEVPHPFVFDRPRLVDAEVAELSRVETALHARLVWIASFSRVWQLSLGAGPSLFRARGDRVQGVNLREIYPYDEATFESAVTSRQSASEVGYNVSVDVTRYLARHIGVAAAVTYARAASADLGEAGGADANVGIRFGF